MRQVIIQCLIAQHFKAYGINDYCYNFKRNQKSFKIHKFKNLMKCFMKSCSKSINKATKQMFEAKNVINYSSLETVCVLCLPRLSYKSTEKLFKKDEEQKSKRILKRNIFKSQKRLRITTKNVINVINETKPQARKKQIHNVKKTFKNSYETKWSEQSTTTSIHTQKKFNQQKYLRLLMSEVELHGDKNKSKKEKDENFFFYFNLKVIKTNSYKPKTVEL